MLWVFAAPTDPLMVGELKVKPPGRFVALKLAGEFAAVIV